MSGPVLSIELAGPVTAASIEQLRELLRDSSTHVEERRVGEFYLHARMESFGITDAGTVAGRRPFLVSLMGPGVGDEAIFDAEHADQVDHESLIGFTPTHAVDVIAFRNDLVDHVVAALLTAAMMVVVGGVAHVELREDQVPIMTDLPGVVTTTTGPSPVAYGSAAFLRAWAEVPGFQLLK